MPSGESRRARRRPAALTGVERRRPEGRSRSGAHAISRTRPTQPDTTKRERTAIAITPGQRSSRSYARSPAAFRCRGRLSRRASAARPRVASPGTGLCHEHRSSPVTAKRGPGPRAPLRHERLPVLDTATGNSDERSARPHAGHREHVPHEDIAKTGGQVGGEAPATRPGGGFPPGPEAPPWPGCRRPRPRHPRPQGSWPSARG